ADGHTRPEVNRPLTSGRCLEEDARPIELVEALEDVYVLEQDASGLVPEHRTLHVFAEALDRLDQLGVVAVARHEQRRVIGVLVGERQGLDRDGDVDALLDERPVVAPVQRAKAYRDRKSTRL